LTSSNLRRPRAAALAGISMLVVSAAIVSFAESYRALMIWATAHGLHGAWAALFPVQVDSFIAVGELALIVALADRWTVRSRVGAWLVAGLGLAVSVAANVGHVAGHDVASRFTAAVPPLAASAALAVGLGVLKRVVGARPARATEPAAALDTLTGSTRPPLHLAWPPRTSASATGTGPRNRTRTASRGRARRAPVTYEDAALRYASEIAAGRTPSMRRVRAEMRVGQARAQAIVAHLGALAEAAAA